ncbi:MAG: flavodoxin family protein [Eubacteriales bacterium]
MKIGIIVNSLTGNTLSVAERIKDTLTAKGHNVHLGKIKVVNEKPKEGEKIQIVDYIDVAPYDALIFGAPVNAFSLAPIMKEYLFQLPVIKDRKVVCFMTQHFPKPWMGGNRALNQMKQIISDKKGQILSAGIVNWTNKRKEEQIDQLQREIADILK